MFLLASLHMDSLTQSTNQKILRDILKELPDNMKNAYDETMERVNHQGKHKSALAIHIFGWIVFARHSLTVLELQHALAVELDTMTLDSNNLCSEDLLGSVCGGLVIIDQTGRHREPIVRFVHKYYTTQQYFMSQKDRFFPHLQETITRTCQTYMLFNGSSDLNVHGSMSSSDDDCHPNIPHIDVYGPGCQKYPFLCYLLFHWGYHASKLQCSMGHEIIAFLDLACCRKVTKLFHVMISYPDAPSIPLHFAVEYGLLHIMELLLNRGDDPCQCIPSLLETAVYRHNIEIVKLLLDLDKINPNTQLLLQQTPLSYAVEQQSVQLLELLLQSGQVDVNCKDSTGCTPLMLAVSSGNMSIVKVLLKHTGIDILARDKIGNPAYAYACWQYSQEPDFSDNDGMFALLEKYGGRPPIAHYEPTYPLATCLPNEQLNSGSGFRIPLDSSTTFPSLDHTGLPPCYDTNGDPIYIGSAILRDAVLPCKIGSHLSVSCLVPSHGCEIAHMGRYNLLLFNPDTMEFVHTSRGHFPAGRKLVKGGHN
ncbi:ankyrin repeat-containing domain protein [Armillaria borealis]|uniref:Ankyrin repeat-containing domain protein n=1 Tax=Armillaria borealis TaxID=47425 RepID=A0AA39IW82_9AGAR|nr:ankyrin repeat-containing domain protein [Armillaria borealis]